MSNTSYRLVVTDQENPDAEHAIEAGLGEYNRQMAGYEAEAKKRGVLYRRVYTITFQAPGFYERRGYRVLGRITCPPPGHTRICMTKTL